MLRHGRICMGHRWPPCGRSNGLQKYLWVDVDCVSEQYGARYSAGTGEVLRGYSVGTRHV